MVRIGMHFYQQSIRPAATAARAMAHIIALARSMRRVGNYRKMRERFHHRNRRDIHRVPRGGFKSPDAALAKYHFVVAAGHDVFGREQ